MQPNTKNELRKALTTTGDGAALLPYDLEPTLNEELMKLQPLAELIETVPAESKVHEYRVRTSHPQGWFEGESTAGSSKNSAYQSKFVQLKIQRIWGSVTGFAKVMDEKFVDALVEELNGSLEGMANTLEYGLTWGASDDLGFTGDPYQYSGLFSTLAAKAPQNIIDAGGAKVSLDLLDQALAKVNAFRGTSSDPKLWEMGLRMKQVVDGLQTRVSIPLTSSELNDGRIVMANYSNVPIYETDYLVPEDVTSSPDCSAAAAAGGSLEAGDYTYRIASVTMYGEQVAGVASDSITADDTNKTADLTWTPDASAKLYLIFRKAGSGDFMLLDIIPALTYDETGAVNGTVASYVDAGTKTAVSTVRPLETGEQNIMITNRNPARGIAKIGKIDEAGRRIDNLFVYDELAHVKDSYDYMLKGYLAMRAKYPNVAGAVIRKVKTSA